MQVRTKITLCVSSLAAVIVACAGLLLWNTERSTYNHQRSSFVHKELAGYLQLSGEVFRTFKQARRDLMDGDGVLDFDLEGEARRIAAIVAEIRADEAAWPESGPPDSDEISDLARIEALDTELAQAFADLRETRRRLAEGQSEDARAFLGASLESRIDGRVAGLIEEGLADERAELAEALAEIENMNRIAFWAAIAATVAGLALSAAAIFTLVLRLRTSLIGLETGAAIFAAGRLDHEIPAGGRDEFALLARRFNAMAGQLLLQRKALEEARSHLEQRVAERTKELGTANAELERRDTTRRRFFADIGHELRTPITAVKGEAEVALRTRQDQEATYRDALARIIGIADQLTRFVNDIFLIAREQSGVLDLRKEVVDLRTIVTAALAQLHAPTAQHRASVVTELGRDEVLIEGDEQRLCQLLRILLYNAIEHAPDGVRIRVALRPVAGCWELSVEDDGPGIAADDRAQVFERFYRGAASADPSRGGGGTGLGLPIAKSLVQAHGGRIWIDPDYGPGTAVRSVFPALEAAAREDEAPGDEADEALRAAVP